MRSAISRLMVVSIAAFGFVTGSLPVRAGAIPQDVASLGAPDAALEKQIEALAQTLPDARIGFAAVDLAKGRTAFLREGELFPMQSVCKLPIAIAFLEMVERGEADLNRLVTLTAADIAPGRSPLARKLRVKPTRFTARQLIEHILLNSDNTATDALLKLGGGPARFQQTLNRFGGLQGLRLDRYESRLQAEAVGLPPSADWSDPVKFDAAIAALGPEKQQQALEKFMRDPRDAASPRAIASLYFKLLSGHLLELQHTRFILDLMHRTRTGADRLNGGIPSGWKFAHRGGQSRAVNGITAAYNDTGLATTKTDAGIVIVLFVKGSRQDTGVLAKFHRDVASTVLKAWGTKPKVASK